MTIMVAGGVTFAVPGVTPVAYAEVTTSNPHLYVSAEGQDADNQFAEGNIIEVIVRDDSIGDTDEGEAEPDVTINGADLRMLQTANGDWRAYFAQAAAIAGIDGDGNELDYGVFCDANTATSIAGGKVNLRDTNGVYFPPGSVSNTACELESTSMQDPNHPLIRETRDLTTDGNGLGQLALNSTDLWPFIQVFDFASESNVKIVYNKGGTAETVTLEFDDPSESHSLDRAKYPQGAHVLVTIEDYALNIDPTDEDTWAFDTNSQGGLGAYYNLFDEDGKAENIMRDTINNYADEVGIGEQLKIVRNGQDSSGDNPIIDCQVTKDFGIQDEGNANMDYLVSNDDSTGACVPTSNIPSGSAAHGIFTADNFVVGFVEDGSNTNEFINWAEDQRANLVVPDDAQRNRSFEIDYNAPGAISGVVGHFFAELTLGDSGATWNSGERIGFTVTDEDANTNPLAENDLTVANPDSLLVPAIKIGKPVTLANASNVVWVDTPNAPIQPTPDTTPPVIMMMGGNVMLSNTTTTATTAYTDAGATCTDNTDNNPTLTTTGVSEVHLNAPGMYTITYTCVDAAGNSAIPMTRTVNVTSDPVITIVGGNPMIAQSSPLDPTPYVDGGATCDDDNDGMIAVITHNASSIDTSRLGTQTITYTCTDMAGNSANATRTVTVTDQDRPQITITGGNTVEVDQDATYTDAGATCADGDDGSNIPNIADNASAIDTSMVGDQMVTYTCTDLQGNTETATRTVTVVDVTDPVITVNPLTVSVSESNAPYTDMGVTCTDNEPNVGEVMTSGTVDRKNSGDYPLTYTCEDAAGNSDTATRIVTVEIDNVDPEINNGAALSSVTISRDATDASAKMIIEAGVDCTDNLDATPILTDDWETAVDRTTNGDYRVTFTCTDDNNNDATMTRMVTVADDTTDPILDVSGVTTTLTDAESFDVDAEIAKASCTDDVALPSGAITAISNVVSSTVGNYNVVYTCTDASKNTVNAFVGVTVTSSGQTVPGAPQNLRAEAESQQVVLTWDAPTDTGNDAISDYKIEYRQSGSSSWTLFSDAVDAAITETVTGLTNGQAYEFRVNATNGQGTGPASDVATATPTAAQTVPGAPQNLQATSGNNQVVLTWEMPTTTGNDPITDYKIEYRQSGSSSWTLFSDAVDAAITETVTGLTNGQAYEFRVNATNGQGTGPASDVATATPTAAQTVPGAPQNLRAEAESEQVVLTWDAPTDTGNDAISDYKIEYRQSGSSSWTLFSDAVDAAITETVTGLTNGQAYEFRVNATNGQGTGPASDVATATPMAPTPTAPLVLDDFGTLQWVNDTDGIHKITIPITGQVDITPTNASVRATYPSPTQLSQSSIELHINPDENGPSQFRFTNVTGDPETFNATLAVTADGKITATVILHSNNGHEVLAGTTANFTLRAENVTASFNLDFDDTDVLSNVISKMIPPIPTGESNNVDMTTTPISGNAAGFPPITRTVINDVSEIPAIHTVQQSSTTAPSWSIIDPNDNGMVDTDEIYACDEIYANNAEGHYCVEKFSERLRLAEPGDMMISGDSEIVIDWVAPPTSGDGVTAMFNWDFSSLERDHVGVEVTGVYLGSVMVSEGPDHESGLVELDDTAGMTGTLTIKMNGDVTHICNDITLVADYLTFGQTGPEPDDRVNNAIYRLEVEEATPDSADFEATLEYVMLNQLNIYNNDTYTDLRTIDSDVSIIVHEDFTDEDSVRINYFDLGADGVSTQVATQREAPTHSGVVSFDMESYKVADTVTITVEDADLNVDNDVVDIYTVAPSNADVDMNGDAVGEPGKGKLLLEVTFNDERWVSSTIYPNSTGHACYGENVDDFTDDGFESTGFTLMETASGSGVFTGSFQVPNKYCEKNDNNNNNMHVESVTGVDIEVNYYDFRDASGEEIEVGADAAIRANTGTVSLDRTVYPVPFAADVFETADAFSNREAFALNQGNLTVHIRVNDADFDVSASGEDTINAIEYLSIEIIRGAAKHFIPIPAKDAIIKEVAPDAGVFELDLDIAYHAGPRQSCPADLLAIVDRNDPNVNKTRGCILQGDIISVEYVDPTDASGESNTVTDSATFDLRNAVLQSDKSVYIIGSDMILTLIEPDFDLDNDGAETYPLDLIEWDSDAGTLGMGCEREDAENNTTCDASVFDPEPSGLRETGDSTGIFQSIIEIPAELDNDRLERGEEIELEYVDYGPSGSDYVGDETEDINLTVFTSNFGATIELDQKVYTWTDKVYITIVAPDHNFDSALVDEIGDSDDDPIQIATRSDDLDNYKLVETGTDTGIFTGEVILIGFDHNADGDTQTGTISTGYDNPQRPTGGSGPTNGFIETDDDDGITVSFEFSEDETVVGSALIRWNIGEVQWLEASYPATGTGVVRVIDPDMNLDPEAVDNFEVDVWSDKDAGGIDLTVTETNQATGIFEGTVFFTTADESSGHRLRVAEGDTVTAEYEDNTLPDPYTTADELDITATTLIGTIVPPLERAVVSNLRTVDAFENSLDTVSVDQQVQIVADLTSGQDRSQMFAYLVQVQDANGVTVSLAWISGTLEAGQSLSPSSSWIPTEAGTYTATAFVWESVDNPTALSPPVTTTITVS